MVPAQSSTPAVNERSLTIVVTSINPPNRALREIARGSIAHGYRFLVIGDTKSPPTFELPGCTYYGIDAQLASGIPFASQCPTRHYARKNIGYLLAIQNGAPLVIETDDDNLPRSGFFAPRARRVTTPGTSGAGWVNVYRYFSTQVIWPRGLPLEMIRTDPPPFDALPVASLDCPIQQGLADDNPDVDALYRLTQDLPQYFRRDRRVALGRGSLCPFNSQNTTWWPDAYPLLYLPAFCSFRMTDIWRSFVAQRIAWENDWSVLFHEPTVWQERNDHDLMRDFADEVPGYLQNTLIGKTLQALELAPGLPAIAENLRRCYQALAKLNVVGADELPLLDAWLESLEQCRGAGARQDSAR
jgi:hypothetical protein